VTRGEGFRIGEALGMRHEDLDIGGCLVRVVPRDNANGARAKGGRGREIPASAPLMRLYADYLNREYQAIDSDYVFVNLWAGPAGRPMTYPAAYDLVTRLRAVTGVAFSPHWFRHIVRDLVSTATSRRKSSGSCSTTPPPR
jgi:integrase/recombinase XerD